MSLLLWMTLIPFLGAAACFLVPDRTIRAAALVVSLVGLVLGVVLYCAFDASNALPYQLVFSMPWIPALRINFSLGIDGLSLPMVLLTKLMVPVAILASWSENRRVRAFMASFLILDGAMTGTFLATDIFLFYVFWEMMLIPMLLLIGVWGSQERVYASLKFFLYTFAGSILMLVAIFFLFVGHQEQLGFYSSEIRSFYQLNFAGQPVFLGLGTQELVFWGFTLAFAIKVPLFPLHTWLPDAHVQAPTGGSVLLAAVLLKMGTYGLLRFSIPICPGAFLRFAPVLAVLSIVGILYGAWVALAQTDMKKLVAYSSVSHLGFVVLGICSMNGEGLTGAMLQMVNHGLSTGALFFLVGALYERRHSRDFSDFGGLAESVPWLAVVLVFVSASSMGVPGLNGFVGEFLVLFGAFKANKLWAAFAVLGVIFGAAYMLMMVRNVLFGPLTSAENRGLKDLNGREWAGLIPLCALILLLGLYPKPLLEKMEPAIKAYWSSAIASSRVVTR